MSTEQNNETQVSSQKSRRKFIQKASAGVVLLSLPAKSSWASGSGCGTISGQLSGNLSTQTCDPMAKFDGRSGGFWKNINQGQVKSAFNDITTKAQAKTIAIPAIEAVKAQSFGSIFGTAETQSLHKKLKSGGFDKQLVTAYLNAKFEFYNIPDTVTPEAYAASLLAQVQNGTYTETEMIDAIEATHLDGQSDYAF